MRSHAQLLESIHRWHAGFWKKERTDRPPIGVYKEEAYLPIRFLRRPFLHDTVGPTEVGDSLAMTEYEFAFARHSIPTDDFIFFSAPWRGIPWLEACCGCQVRFSEGSLAPASFVGSPKEFAEIPIPAANGWLNRLRSETLRLHAAQPFDCWISPPTLRGPSDVLSAMRGLSNFYLDLYDDPESIAQAAARVNELLIRAVHLHYSIVSPKQGGYGHFFGYWAPGKTISIQEDVMGLCSPGLYRDIFMPCNAALVRRLGNYVLFHLHSTGCRHYKHVLDIPGIAGIELSVETVGPTLDELVPVFREILERSRLMLHVLSGFEQLPGILRKLPWQGLSVFIPDRFISSDQRWKSFIQDVSRKD